MTQFSRAITAALLIGTLAACTATRPPEPYLPSRSNIQPGETITVNSHQNVYALARANNVSMRELIVLNDLHPPFDLRQGQKIILPVRTGADSDSGPGIAPPPDAAPTGVIESAPLPPLDTPVQSVPLGPPPTASSNVHSGLSTGLQGQTSGVTTSYTNLPAAGQNGLQGAQANIQTGAVETLNAPTPPSKPVATTVAGASGAVTNAVSSASNTVSAQTSNAQQAMANAAANVASASAETGGTAPTSMVWPVQGPVLSGFGPKGQGLSNDGVNIGAPKGSAVVAASGGTVAYAGNEMKGFGNLVLIRHPGGVVTAYAHLDRVMVTKDAVVAQGDMIGTVGKTGNVSSPQLHFEVRENGKAVDPAGLISGSSQ